MKRTITRDEKWVYEYDMQTSRQSSEWRYDDELKPKKPRQSRSKMKVILLQSKLHSFGEDNSFLRVV
ncbi:hypothetical protein NQ318_013395 [Aromia moschata]|uniref:Uncharacterized protein n=1 Tax=Aromia moschata TaxID=1265417 RepID=A0AAV8XZ62_9CUCU|nr:hypothetical protein NQ318_013395 [Aromia moschata]